MAIEDIFKEQAAKAEAEKVERDRTRFSDRTVAELKVHDLIDMPKKKGEGRAKVDDLFAALKGKDKRKPGDNSANAVMELGKMAAEVIREREEDSGGSIPADAGTEAVDQDVVDTADEQPVQEGTGQAAPPDPEIPAKLSRAITDLQAVYCSSFWESPIPATEAQTINAISSMVTALRLGVEGRSGRGGDQ